MVFAAIEIGELKFACCHPVDVSLVNVTLPSSAPALVQSEPTWVPAFNVVPL